MHVALDHLTADGQADAQRRAHDARRGRDQTSAVISAAAAPSNAATRPQAIWTS
jgi:hypothetical protein